MSSGAARRRYARQLSLGEIGESGQERLLAARFVASPGCDREAYAVAAQYLERAGCSFDLEGTEVRVADPDAVARFAGMDELRGAAAAVAGAFAAVEYLKRTLGLASARDLPSDLRLHDES